MKQYDDLFPELITQGKNNTEKLLSVYWDNSDKFAEESVLFSEDLSVYNKGRFAPINEHFADMIEGYLKILKTATESTLPFVLDESIFLIEIGERLLHKVLEKEVIANDSLVYAGSIFNNFCLALKILNDTVLGIIDCENIEISRNISGVTKSAEISPDFLDEFNFKNVKSVPHSILVRKDDGKTLPLILLANFFMIKRESVKNKLEDSLKTLKRSLNNLGYSVEDISLFNG